MQKLLGFIKRNILSVILGIFAIAYIIVESSGLEEFVAIVAGLYILLFSMLTTGAICRTMIEERAPMTQTFKQHGWELLLFLVSGIALYLVKGWNVLSALLLATILFSVFFAVLYIFKRKYPAKFKSK